VIWRTASISSWGSNGLRNIFCTPRGVDLIAKPYTQTELAAKVRKVLDHAR